MKDFLGMKKQSDASAAVGFFIEAPPPGLAAPFSARQQKREYLPATAHNPKLFQLEGFFGHEKTVRRVSGCRLFHRGTPTRARRALFGAATKA
ncbi:MAG: hypothetical protein ABR572_05285, partial [Cryomorphaceae bacterium]